MGDLFREWDVNGNGLIDKMELRDAVKALGYDQPNTIVDAVFAEYDTDGSGEMAYIEYLRYSLRDALMRSVHRVMTLFKQWDHDGSGSVDKTEFRKAIKELGFDAPVEALDEIFNEMDADQGGCVDFKELNKVLRQGASIILKKSLQKGAAGKISRSAAALWVARAMTERLLMAARAARVAAAVALASPVGRGRHAAATPTTTSRRNGSPPPSRRRVSRRRSRRRKPLPR